MNLYKQLVDKTESLALVGLGYVGMPIALAFARKGLNVIGFDLNKAKIDLYKSGRDPTLEVGDEAIRSTTVQFTADETELRKAKFIIVAVPTPVDRNNNPDLRPLYGASTTVGKYLILQSVSYHIRSYSSHLVLIYRYQSYLLSLLQSRV